MLFTLEVERSTVAKTAASPPPSNTNRLSTGTDRKKDDIFDVPFVFKHAGDEAL